MYCILRITPPIPSTDAMQESGGSSTGELTLTSCYMYCILRMM